jgi:hypothetical protein
MGSHCQIGKGLTMTTKKEEYPGQPATMAAFSERVIPSFPEARICGCWQMWRVTFSGLDSTG